MIHQARDSRFGRAHDFRRIRCALDFRRLVPLSTPGDPLLPAIQRPAMLPAALRAACRAALRTALSVVADHLPGIRLLDGSLLLLPQPAIGSDHPRTLLPRWLRPYAGDAGPVRCIVGRADGIAALAGTLDGKGRSDLRSVWPDLAAVLYTSRHQDDTELLQAVVGRETLLVRIDAGPEGPIAVEGPRSGLRLLMDHGLYFELLPAGAGPEAHRFGLEEAKRGVSYELVVTSPAGLWACRTGRGVCFEHLAPPMFRYVDLPPAPTTVSVARTDAAVPTFPAQPPHRQTAGTPATPPGTPFHNLWSALAGRG